MKCFEAEDIEKRETNYDVEEMSHKEITKVIDQYNDKKTCSSKECEKTAEAHDSLACEYKRLEKSIID